MEWFSSLPVHFQLAIIILIIFSTVIISIYGGVKIQKNKNDLSINIGGEKNKDFIKGDTEQKRIRKCEDCYMILRDYLLKIDRRIKSLEDAKFYKPLNYLDQKLDELTMMLVNDYLDVINEQATNEEKSSGETIKQLRLFEAHIKDACGRIKTEVRRALRENGFAKLQSKDFICYVNSEITVILNTIFHHIRSVYPSNSSCMIIDINEVLSLIEQRQGNIAKIVEEFFSYTVDMINQLEQDIQKLEKESIEWCKNFISREDMALVS